MGSGQMSRLESDHMHTSNPTFDFEGGIEHANRIGHVFEQPKTARLRPWRSEGVISGTASSSNIHVLNSV
jgi:hypothetical protein